MKYGENAEVNRGRKDELRFFFRLRIYFLVYFYRFLYSPRLIILKRFDYNRLRKTIFIEIILFLLPT